MTESERNVNISHRTHCDSMYNIADFEPGSNVK